MLMVWFSYFCKKMPFILGKAHADPIFEKLGPIITIIEGFNNFFQNYWIATFHWKSPKRFYGQNLG